MTARIPTIRRLARAQRQRSNVASRQIIALEDELKALIETRTGFERMIEQDIVHGLGHGAIAAARLRATATRRAILEAELQAASTMARATILRATALERLLERLSREEFRLEEKRDLATVIESLASRLTQAPDKEPD